MIDRIDAALATAATIVTGITADRLAAPTPCPGWDVRIELNHLVGGMRIFAAELTGTAVDRDHHDDWLGTEPQDAFTTAARLDRDAWQRPGALTGTVRLGFGPVPATLAALIHLTELVVHTADLAVATGQEHRLDQRQCARLLDTLRDNDFDAYRRPGMFGPGLPAPCGAPGHRRLLAFTGRTLPGE